MSNSSTAVSNVIPFDFESRQVRTVIIEDQPWFVAKDVLASLEYAESSNPARVMDHVPEQWKGVNPIHTLGGLQKLLMISEQGLYFFVCRSDKPKALPFQMWLAGDVLPAIRKHGRYEDKDNQLPTLIGQTIGTDGFHMLGAVIKGKVVGLPKSAQRRATMKIWAQTHVAFGVRSAADIPADKLDAARNFIAAYVLEGEYLPKEEGKGVLLNDHDLYKVWYVCRRFQNLNDIRKRTDLCRTLSALGSPIGKDMIDHFKDGGQAVTDLFDRFGVEMDAAAQRLGVNQYCDQARAVA
ncbi:phage antirepressor protein [Pseudomonas lutea]|uniref:Phage antirepressor protein n=2 Tax=Pseudomonas luteola TaxID=47886 RepID=A0ABS0MV17_PSELU|nr:phage antirepressor protein [Pseudomonas luteola]